MEWLLKHKWYIFGLVLVASVFLMGRWCAPNPEDPRIDSLEQTNNQLENALNRSDLRLDSMEVVVSYAKDSVRLIEQENTLKNRKISSIINQYEKKIHEISQYTPEQVDSFFVIRYPGVEGHFLDIEITEDLLERDKFEKIVTIQKQQLEIKDRVIDKQNEIIVSMELIKTELKDQLKIKSEQISNLEGIVELERKKVRKVKWQRNGITSLAVLLGIIAIFK